MKTLDELCTEMFKAGFSFTVEADYGDTDSGYDTFVGDLIHIDRGVQDTFDAKTMQGLIKKFHARYLVYADLMEKLNNA